jgi:isoleucyl-tRNA synthetase
MEKSQFAKNEEEVLKYWEDNKIFEKTLKKESPKGNFVFFEGPPTANGLPGIHHILARAFKDVIPRFKTMQGYNVDRKAGWDTHGLPVELQVEKQLEISGKPQIEEYGVEAFNEKCKASVWTYQEEWQRLTQRIAYWLDLDKPYVTYHNDYIETLWWILKQVSEKDLLYKGYKVVPHCPRCGTALSSHEVAQGYKLVKENSVYMKFKVLDQEDTYILSWTTTPWTLPGNVALAVGEDIDYVKVEHSGEKWILAQALLGEVFDGDMKIVEEMKGKDLIGTKYEPLFPGAIPKDTENYENGFQVYSADFVTTSDGTGVVHTAVLYGEDDYQLGEAVGLPKFHTVGEDGKFLATVERWQGKFVKNKTVEGEIIEDLKTRGLLYGEKEYEHDYPYCWRCDSPLLYYAKDSWFIKMSVLREELLENNKKINWVPGYIKDGRFGEWLANVKDWAISRQRYWGTPIPVWQCTDCKKVEVVGSYDELRENSKQNLTKLIFVRHGESEKNVGKVATMGMDSYPLTKEGEKCAKVMAESYSESVDVIYASASLRTKQTAEILAKKLGVEVVYDEDLLEINHGEWEGKSYNELVKLDAFKEYKKLENEKRFEYKLGGGESRADVVVRIERFIKKVNKEYVGKNVMVVSHGAINGALKKILEGVDFDKYFVNETVEHAKAINYYVTEAGKGFDPHRPFIDEYKLKCECGGEMTRSTDVFDCWYDSGSMPFAQHHYPFENKELVDSGEQFPADYISEAIDQTRGWFYTLLAVSTLLGKGNPYKNVVCLAHIRDAKGKKMSKSKGNVIDPWMIADKYGVDALRMQLYTMNQPGEPKNFDEKQTQEILRKVVMLLGNVVNFYELYKKDSDNFDVKVNDLDLSNVLDSWVVAKTNLFLKEVTDELGEYKIFEAGRQVIEFIDELSTWYVRRSRDRFKSGGTDGENAKKTLLYVLNNLVRVMAPFTPFVAESLYLRLGGNLKSVHLEDWPVANEKFIDENLLKEMKRTRKVIELGLSARDDAKIKVRQPLEMVVYNAKQLSPEFEQIIADELNVKQVLYLDEIIARADGVGKEDGSVIVSIKTTITEELKMEGLVREITRKINSVRKNNGLTISDKVKLIYSTDSEVVQKVFVNEVFREQIKEATLLSDIEQGEGEKEVKVNEEVLKISLVK